MLKQLLFLSVITTPLLAESTVERCLHTCYAWFLGNQDATLSAQQAIREALRNVGTHDTDKVAIKQMTPRASQLVGEELSSFTLFGMWVDEKSRSDNTLQIFKDHHEASHHKLRHHPRLLKRIAACAGIASAAGWLASRFGASTIARVGIGTLSAAAIMTLLIYKFLLPHLRNQEKEADVLAAQTLQTIGRQDIVDDYLHRLELLAGHEKGSPYFPSIQESIDSLKGALKK